MTAKNHLPIETIKVHPEQKELWKRCEEVEYDVFVNSGFIPENKEKRYKKYDKYLDHSKFFCTFIKDDKPLEERIIAGVSRTTIGPDQKKMEKGILPTVDVEDEIPFYEEMSKKLWETEPRKFYNVDTIAIPEEYQDRTKIVVELTRQTIFDSFKQPDVRYGLGTFDFDFYNTMKKKGLPWQELGPPTFYMGSYTVPAIGDSYKVFKGGNIAIPFFKNLIKAKNYIF